LPVCLFIYDLSNVDINNLDYLRSNGRRISEQLIGKVVRKAVILSQGTKPSLLWVSPRMSDPRHYGRGTAYSNSESGDL